MNAPLTAIETYQARRLYSSWFLCRIAGGSRAKFGVGCAQQIDQRCARQFLRPHSQTLGFVAQLLGLRLRQFEGEFHARTVARAHGL